MKTVDQLLHDLAVLRPVFGFNPPEIDQTSDEWHMLRLGVFTASKAECLIKKKHGSKGTEYGTDYLPASSKDSKRNTYLMELVSEVATGRSPNEVSAKPLQWGRDNEDLARATYEAATFSTVNTMPFIYKDTDLRAGISPDGLISDNRGGLELKCPWASKVFIEFLADETIKHEYRHQCQFSIWVTGADYWDFASFDPRMINTKKLHHVRIERCEKAMAVFDEAYIDFVTDMDKALDRIGATFGQQWNPDFSSIQIAA